MTNPIESAMASLDEALRIARELSASMDVPKALYFPAGDGEARVVGFPVQASPQGESGERGYERAFREGLETGYQCGMAGERPAANAWECSDAIHEVAQVDERPTG